MKKLFIIALIFAALACGCADGSESVSENFSESREEEISARRLVERALVADDWSDMEFVGQREYISAYFDPAFDIDDYEDFCFSTNIISSKLHKIVVIKPRSGREDAARAAIGEFLAYIKSEAAAYPDQIESANGAASGEKDGFLYLIVHKNAQKIAEKMFARQSASE